MQYLNRLYRRFDIIDREGEVIMADKPKSNDRNTRTVQEMSEKSGASYRVISPDPVSVRPPDVPDAPPQDAE
jgi:hypothetical protein